MKYIITLTILLWLPSVLVLVRNLFEDTLFWQLKEYRRDRAWVEMRFGDSKPFRGIKYFLIKLGLLILLIAGFKYFDYLFFFTTLLIFTLYFVQTLQILKSIFDRSLKKPGISARNMLIIIPQLFLIFLIPIFLISIFIFNGITDLNADYPINPEVSESLSVTNTTIEDTQVFETINGYAFIILSIYGSILLFEILQPVFTSLLVAITAPIAYTKRKILINKARKKLLEHKKLITIGITGSYGKTSSKELLYQLLSKKFQVAITPGNKNTDIGIAESILTNLKPDTEIFIAEMGAYKVGEIKKAVDLLPLDIAIVTNIGKSHIDLFGSMDKIKTAKYELVEGLKRNGKAILNGDNDYTLWMAEKNQKESILFTINEHNSIDEKSNYLLAKDIEWDGANVKVDFLYKGDKRRIRTKVIGEHLLLNLLPVIVCAVELGFTLEEIQKYLKEMTIKSSHFNVTNRDNKLNIIDDSYNSNPEGFDSALKYLNTFTTKNKVVITKGIPEVGKEIGLIYNTLAEKIINSSTNLLTSDPLLYTAISSIDPDFNLVLIKDNQTLNIEIKKLPDSNTSILIEGRVHPDTLDAIYKIGKKTTANISDSK